MFDILADLKNVQSKESLKIKLQAPNIEELFLSWLSELLYRYNAKTIILKKFEIGQLTDKEITAVADYFKSLANKSHPWHTGFCFFKLSRS